MSKAQLAEYAFAGVALVGLGVVIWQRSVAAPLHYLPPPAVEIRLADLDSLVDGADLVHGESTSQIRVVEFSDYECPPCRAARLSADDIGSLTGVAFYSQRFPLTMHAHAKPLALIANSLKGKELAAFESGAWSKSGADLDALIGTWSKRLNKRSPGWQQEAQRRLSRSKLAGLRAGVQGTPTFFVQDKRRGHIWRCANVDAAAQAVASASG